MNSFQLRPFIVLGVIAISSGLVWAQPAANTSGISARDRYSGPLGAQRDARTGRTPAALAAGARLDAPVVHYGEISLRPGIRAAGSTAATGQAPTTEAALATLPLKARGGFLIYELRAGRLTTIINGNRQERRLGEFWIVGPTDKVTLETGDDSVVVQTLQLPGQ